MKRISIREFLLWKSQQESNVQEVIVVNNDYPDEDFFIESFINGSFHVYLYKDFDCQIKESVYEKKAYEKFYKYNRRLLLNFKNVQIHSVYSKSDNWLFSRQDSVEILGIVGVMNIKAFIKNEDNSLSVSVIGGDLPSVLPLSSLIKHH